MIVGGKEIAAWVFEPHGGTGKGSNAIGWVKDGRLTCGFAVSEWTGKNCFVHIRLEGYCPRQFWFAMVDWVFNEMKCKRMTAPVSASNVKCLDLLDHIGWTREATLKESAYDGEDLHFLTWEKHNCYMLQWGKRREANHEGNDDERNSA